MLVNPNLVGNRILPSESFKLAYGNKSAQTADTWLTSKYWYGRVIRTATMPLAAIPETDLLEQIPPDISNDETLFAMTFVTKALTGLWNQYHHLANMGKLPKDMFYVKSAWRDVEVDYDQYLDTLYAIFKETLLVTEKYKKIDRVADFAQQFVYFIKEYADLFPVSFTSFIGSANYSPLSSGIVIDLMFADPDIQDKPEYRSFLKLASAHGFFIDANLHGRLYADVGHPSMKNYMASSGIENADDSRKSMLEFLHPVYAEEMTRLQALVIDMYQLFIQEFPKNYKTEVCNGKTVIRQHFRDADTQAMPTQWLELYTYIRAKESNMKMSQGYFDTIRTSTAAAYKQGGAEKAISVVEFKFPITGRFKQTQNHAIVEGNEVIGDFTLTTDW